MARAEALEALDERDTAAVLIIPAGMEASLKAGQPVRLTVAQRSGREVEVIVVPAEADVAATLAPTLPVAPSAPAARSAPGRITPAPLLPPSPPDTALALSPPDGLPLRYLGTLAGVELEVRGAPVAVTELRGARTILIQADGLWIRVRIPPGGGGEGS